MYFLLKNEILEQAKNIEVVSKVEYIAFKLDSKNLFDIKLLKLKIILWFNRKKDVLTPNLASIFIDCSNKGHHGNGDYEKHFNSISEVKNFIDSDVIGKILLM